MKTKYIFASCLLASMTWTGCQEIDTFPEGGTVTSDQKEEIAEKNPERAEAGVNAIFALFSQYGPNENALGVLRHNDFGYPTIMLATDANGADVVSDNNGYNWAGNSLTYEDRSYTSYECQMVWNDLYSTIYAANNVIATIDPATEEPTTQKFLGQALAARAFGYFVLAQLYQFNYVGHESDPCVPLITNENSAEAAQNGIGRATVEEVYTQIHKDLDQSITLLESAEEAGETRADKRYINASVAYGIRARVNLTMQKWNEAKTDAETAISIADATPASIADVSKPTFCDLGESDWMWGINVDETDDIVSQEETLKNEYGNVKQNSYKTQNEHMQTENDKRRALRKMEEDLQRLITQYDSEMLRLTTESAQAYKDMTEIEGKLTVLKGEMAKLREKRAPYMNDERAYCKRELDNTKTIQDMSAASYTLQFYIRRFLKTAKKPVKKSKK